jgi:serine/threonine-protein phosphatase 6 regulatory subunit 3
MSLLNRSADYDYLYDSEGRLQGGLSALEELAQVISLGSGSEDNRDAMDEGVDEIEPALEFPVHGAPQDSSSLLDSDEDMSDDECPGSFEDDLMEDVAGSGELKSSDAGSKPKSSPLPSPHIRSPAETAPDSTTASPSPGASLLLDAAPSGGSVPPRRRPSNRSIGSEGSTIGRRSGGSRRSSSKRTLADASQTRLSVPVGERLKHRMLDDQVLATILVREILWNSLMS